MAAIGATASKGTSGRTRDPGAHGAHMDRIYRLTRHVYDATRKFFLLGRDALLDAVPEDARLAVEVGCGTARNLVLLARRRPGAALFGLDASAEMLRSASAQVARAGIARRVTLRHALAEDLRPALFGLDRPFDAVLFPYSLSMMPGWREALDAAIASVRPGGVILIVDFWDQASWPGPARRVLVWWLGLFSVRFRPEVLEHLRGLHDAGAVRLDVRGIGGRYAYIARLERA